METKNERIERLKNLSNEELLQMYANARSTCSCAGHHKGRMNELFVKQYATELESRGIVVPKDIFQRLDKNFHSNVEIPEGLFNGVGSY